MTWIKKISPPPPNHVCCKPSSRVESFDSDSVWQCDRCEKYWIFNGSTPSSPDDWTEIKGRALQKMLQVLGRT